MLGADPRDYSEDDDIGYTIPDERTRPVGISKTLLIAGASMIAFPIVQGILSKSLKGLSRYTAGVAKRYAGERYNQVYNRIGGSPTLGKILGESQPVKDMTTKYLRWRGDISEYTGIKNAQGIVTKVGWANQAKGRWQHVRSFFKDYGTTAFRSRMMGASENFVKGYLKVLPSVYLSDKAISLFTGEKRKEGTAWWNIPGHVVNTAADVLTTSAAYLPIHAAFAGIMGGAKLAKESVVRSARYASLRHHTSRGSTSILAETLGNVFSKVDDFRTKLLGTEQHPGFEARIRGATKEWFRSFSTDWKDKKPATMDTIDYWKGNIVAGWKKGIVPPRHFLTQVPHAQFLKDIEKVSGFPMGSNTVQILKMISDQYKRPKMGFLSRMAGLRPLRVKEYIGMQNIEQHLSRESMKNMAANMPEDQRVNLRKWLSTAYMGKGIYQGPSGKPINISKWQPTAILDRSIDFLHEKLAFNTPFGKLRPFEMFRVKRMKDWLLGKAPNVYDWTEGNTVRIGPHPDTNIIMNNYNPYGATVTLEPGDKQRMLFVKSKGGAGKMFYHQEGMADAVDITPEGTSYRLVHEPLHGSLRRVQDRYYGKLRDPLNRFEARNPDEEMRMMQESYGWPKWRAFLHAKVLRTPVDRYNMEEKHGRWPGLEIGAGYGSSPGPLRRLGNFYMKYFREDSPLVVFNKDKGFLSQIRKERNPGNYISEGNVDDAGRFISQTRNMLSDALDSSWHNIRSRKVYERFSKHTVQVPGWEGKAPTFEDLYGDSLSSRQRLVTAVDRILGVPGSESPANRRIRHILDMVKDDEGQWSHVAAKSPTGKELTAGDELQKYIFRYHLVGQARTTRGQRYLQNLTKDINIGRERLFTGINPDRTMMRSIDNLSRLESMAGDIDFGELKGPRRELLLHELLGPTRAAKHGRINNIVDFMMGESQNLDELSQVFNPPTSTRLPNILHAPIYSGTTTTSPYEAVISGSPSLGGIFRGDKKDIRSIMGAIRNTILPRYANKYGDIDQNAQPILQPHRFLMEATMRFERLGEGLGLGLNPSTRTTWQDIWAGTFSRVVLPGMALYSGYKALDTFTDTSPLFSGTALDEGLSVGLAEQYVKSNLLAASVYDTIGVTPASKYMEGLMPGFVSSPAARLARAVGPPILGAAFGMKFGPHGAGLGVITGTAISALSGFGTYDMTKTRKELEDIYSGRELVPIRKNRAWEFSRSSYFGDRISYWRPNWFSKMKSQYQYTPDMYGSKLEEFIFRNPIMQPFALAVDPYHWERKSYFSSPYPETGAVLESIPFIGPALSTTVGRALKPIKLMHKAELQASFNGPGYMSGISGIGPGYFPPPGIQADIPSPFVPATMAETNSEGLEIRRPYPISQHSVRQTVGRLFNTAWTEPFGLWGWGSSQAMGGGPAINDVVMANSGERTSVRRALWDMQLGGGAIVGEYLRRFYPRMQTTLERWNPLKNKSPSWLPGGPESKYFTDFRTGSPYDKIKDSELRLPGWGNMSAYHVSLSMPFRASQLGKSYEEMIQYITGTAPPTQVYEEEVMEAGTTMHRMVQDELRRSNLLVKAEAPVYEPYSDISGTVDAIVREGRRKVALEIKTVDSKKLASLAAPQRQHMSQLNFYLKVLGLPMGKLVYISRDDPSKVKSFPVHYSEGAYRRDLSRLQQARSEGYQLLRKGYGEPGEAYSHLDRLRVTADVCIPPDTILQYGDGIYVRADNVNVDDNLISHTGNSRRVNSVYKREYTGEIYRIRTYYQYEDLIVTPTHPVYAKRSHICDSYCGGKWGYCRPHKNCINRGVTCKRKYYESYTTEFIPANELKVGDIVLYPILREEPTPNSINVTDVVDTGYILLDNGMVKPYGKGFNIYINNTIRLDSEFFRLAGWYLAEGCVSHSNDVPRAVEFVFNSDEGEYIEDVINLMHSIFGIIPYVMCRGTSTRVSVSNQLVAKLFLELFGEKDNKHLPGFMLHARLDLLERFIYSYFRGDGYVCNKGNDRQLDASVTSVSLSLVSQVRNVLLRFGIMAGIQTRRRDGIETTICGRNCINKDSYIIRITNRDDVSMLCNILDIDVLPYTTTNVVNKRGWIENGYVHLPIISIDVEDYDGLVYNYDIDIDNSYCTISHTVHNCPYSDEYKRELSIVNRRDRLGLLSPEEHEEKLKILRRRDATARQYDLYPRRFDLKHIIKPDSTYQIMAENEYTKSASEYNPIARVAGGAWEYITHQRSPLHTKMMATYSPREQYERYSLYGTKNSFWTEPWRDFVEPYMRATLSTHRPDEGIMRGLQAGYLFGGPAGAVVGAGALGVYGAVNAGFQWLTDSTYIPGNVKKKWEIADYFDKLKYIKARRLYMITGSKEYAQTMGETMTGIDPTGNQWKLQRDIARAIPPDIKPYIFAFIQTTDPGERDKIAKEVPDPVAQLLRVRWAANDKSDSIAKRAGDSIVSNRMKSPGDSDKEVQMMAANYRQSQDLTGYFNRYNMPPEDWAGFDPRIRLEDVELKTVKKMGYSAFDFGQGYADQMRRVRYSPYTPGPINMNDPTGNEVYPELGVDRNELRSSIMSVLTQYGAKNVNVNVSITPGVGSLVQINASKEAYTRDYLQM